MSEQITSLQNQRVKLVYSLQNKTKVRKRERKIVLEGTRLINDALDTGHTPQFVMYESETVDYNLIARLQNTGTELISVSSEVIQHISDTKQPQGIAGIFRLPQPDMPELPQRILILDAIREPGNMGTILRTAGAAGVDLLILAPDCVDVFHPRVLRSGMGAHFRLPVAEATWPQIAAYCEDLNLYAASGQGEAIYTDVDWTQPHALIIGNEAHGIGEKVTDMNVNLVKIPMAAQTESLNAAVATAVILFEGQRQRGGV